MYSVQSIISDNAKRLAEFHSKYDPHTGIGSLVPRKKLVYFLRAKRHELYLPSQLFEEPFFNTLEKLGSIESFLEYLGLPVTEESIEYFDLQIRNIRFEQDFEFWAFHCAKIQDKKSKQIIPFKANRPQRRLISKLEELRLAGVPIRLILLKARQWGGSTCIQIYMAWIQTMHKRNWHSAIVADVENQAKNIRGMYSKLAKNYPADVGKITFVPYEGSSKNKLIAERDCIIGIGSVKEPDSLRSFDFAMLHMSEVGLWKTTANRSAEDLAQSLQATVPDEPYTLVVQESTAKGVGNFFHRQWQNAEKGRSAYVPVFVPWFDIELYQKDVPDYEKFIATWREYEWFLWELGATIEGIYWYISTKEGYDYDDWRMKSEYPSTADEAFQSSGRRAFAQRYVLQARKNCRKPDVIGELFGASHIGQEALKDIVFEKNDKGALYIWAMPDKSVNVRDRYCAFADIGGRSEGADYSCIKVFDRYWMMDGGVPEVVAMWHGHIDQDMFAWKCAQIASFYNNALLAIEVNSLKKEMSEGEHYLTVLDQIAPYYNSLYARQESLDKVRHGLPVKYGFHTNKATKPLIIDTLNAALRENGYIERASSTCDELDYYEIKQDGSYGAVEGQHDDEVIITAGGVWLCGTMPLPKIIEPGAYKSKKKNTISEATI